MFLLLAMGECLPVAVAPCDNKTNQIHVSMQERSRLVRDMKLTLWQLGQMGVSLMIAVPALYIVLSRGYPPQEKNWAFTTLGTILGFWLRGKR
jgi:hypothetical protein